jgi:hypothetical protein
MSRRGTPVDSLTVQTTRRASAAFAIVRVVACELVTSSQPRERNPRLEDLELRTSRQLVAIIDILLGLTLVEGAIAFRSMFTQGSTANAPAMLAMLLIYYTAVRSFIDWHIAMEVRPYRILTYRNRTLELGRVFLDLAIMASYSFLILRAHILIAKPASNLMAIAITYAGIYCAYIVWGELRQRTRPVQRLGERVQPFSRCLLAVTLCFAGVLLAGYVIGRGHRWFGLDKEDFNTAFLAGELLLIVWYRHKNWAQQLIVKDDSDPRDLYLVKDFLVAVQSKISDTVSSAEEQAERDKWQYLHEAAGNLSDDAGLTDVIARLVDHQARNYP